MKNPTHCIDDLLQVVSPSLLDGYKLKNNLEETLKWVNEGYKLDSKKSENYFHKTMILVVILAFVVSGLINIVMFYFKANGYVVICTIAISLILMFFLIWSRTKQQDEYTDTIKKYEELFKEFRQSVLNLNPLTESTVNYNNEFVRHTLVALAGRKHDAEVRFQDACRRFASPEEVVAAANSLIECEKMLEETLSTAEKFGLTFNTKELFAEGRAIKILDDAMPKIER